MFRYLITGSIILLFISLQGCLYRAERQQGNVLEVEQVKKIKIGTSQAEIKSYIGTPLLKHPLDSNHWIYVYQLRLTNGKFFRKYLRLTFNSQGKVINLDKHNIEAHPIVE